MASRIIPAAKLTCTAIMLAAALFCSSPARAQTADSILQKSRDTYLALKSYTDSGEIIDEYGANAKDKHTFATYFKRERRRFLLDFKKQGGDHFVIWGDPDAFHTWWKSTGQETDYPNPQNIPAISLSGYNTKGAAMKIPTLLYGKSQLAAAMLAIADPVLDGTDQIGAHRCYHINGRASDTYGATGKEVNVHAITVWIDADSYLVRRVREEWKTVPGNVSRITTAYEPLADPNVDESRFKFVPPGE